jgi:hypothetical protein
VKHGEPLYLDLIDYKGKRVIFTLDKWKLKSSKHPYLQLPQFKKFIIKALSEPTEVWQDYDEPKKKKCYYYKYNTTYYAKVVVWVTRKPYEVVTVYNLDYIKEMNYPQVRRLL